MVNVNPHVLINVDLIGSGTPACASGGGVSGVGGTDRQPIPHFPRLYYTHRTPKANGEVSRRHTAVA